MRLCPSVEGSGSPLITHRIGIEVCLARQDSNFHKCHRCIYRGQGASWEPASPPLAMLNMNAEDIEVKTVQLGRPAKKLPKSVPPAAAKSAATKAAQAAT
jgi:hypothetical protein